MSSYSKNLLQAMAFDATGLSESPAIARGVHVRILPSNRLQLPVAPLLVYRIDLSDATAEKDGLFRTEGVWRNRYGTGGDLGSALSSGPTTITLGVPPDDACVFVEVTATPGSKITVEAQIRGRGDGTLLVARQTGSERVSLSGFAIDTVVLQGEGQLLGFRWIGLRDLVGTGRPFLTRLRKRAPWAIWSLPSGSGPSYLGLTDPQTSARQRVERGRPVEWPRCSSLQTAPMPLDIELNRLFKSEELWSMLRHVVTLPNPKVPLLYDVSGVDVPGRPKPRSEVHPLEQLLVASHDPSVARWLGFADVDPQPPAPGTLTIYVIRSYFAPDRRGLGVFAPQLPASQLIRPAELGMRLTQPEGISLGDWRRILTASGPDVERLRAGLSEAQRASISLFNQLDRGVGLDRSKQISELWTAAVVRTGGVPEPVPELSVLAATPGAWRADQPIDTPKRHVSLTVTKLVEAAAFALARDVDGTQTYELLNPPGSLGVRVPLLAGPPASAGTPVVGIGVLPDDTCPERAVRYRVSQRDWVGRWSPFVTIDVPQGVRTPPPKPIVDVVYSPIETSWPSQPVAGSFTMTVEVPRELAAGSRRLKRLELGISCTGATPVQSKAVFVFSGTQWQPDLTQSAGAGSPQVVWDATKKTTILRAQLTGPSLPPAAEASVDATARWIDEAGTFAATSQSSRAVDKRPPIPAALPDVLRYSSRPDPGGLAWVRFDLPSGLGVSAWRVYATDDVALLSALRKTGSQQLATDIEAAADKKTRASLIASKQALLRRPWFELVSDRLDPGQTPAVTHAIPGAHAGLMIYRAVPETSDGIAVAFESAPLFVFAVPENSPPAQPGLRVLGVEKMSAGFRVTLRVDLPPGGPPVAALQLRRTRTQTLDPQRMLVVPHQVTASDATSRTLIDELPLEAAWSRISWVVEVRAAGPSAQQPGPFGPPSVPAQRVLVPPDPPEPPQSARYAAGELRFEHARAARAEGFRIAVTRGEGAPEVRSAAELKREGQDTFVWSYAAASAPASGTKLAVVVIDPRDRASQPAGTTV